MESLQLTGGGLALSLAHDRQRAQGLRATLVFITCQHPGTEALLVRADAHLELLGRESRVLLEKGSTLRQLGATCWSLTCYQ